MGCRTIQFSPSSPLLALGGYDNCVRLYNTLTWKEQSIHPHEQSALLDNAVCPLLPSWTPRRPLMLRWTSLICLNPTAVHSVKSSKLSWYIFSFSSRFSGFLGKNAWFFLFLCLSRPGQSYRQTIESIVFFILFLYVLGVRTTNLVSIFFRGVLMENTSYLNLLIGWLSIGESNGEHAHVSVDLGRLSPSFALHFAIQEPRLFRRLVSLHTASDRRHQLEYALHLETWWNLLATGAWRYNLLFLLVIFRQFRHQGLEVE